MQLMGRRQGGFWSSRAAKGVLRAFLAATVLLSSVGPVPVAAPVAVAQEQSTDPTPAATPQTRTNAQANASQVMPVEVSITAAGFQPSVIEINAGQPVHFTNSSPQTQSVTHDGASASGKVLFDSGDIPPGGGYSVTLLAPGDHAFRSNTTALSGTLRIKATGLPGNPGDLARDRIPALAFPRAHTSDIDTHPQFGIQASRTRIMVGFTPTATVTQANAALAAAGASVIGGLPTLGIALLSVLDSTDFSTLTAALASLRANPAISFASMSTELTPDVTPRPLETGMTAGLTWDWDDRDPAGQWAPKGENANLEYVRAPEAWNLLQAIKKKAAPVQTAIVDGGFESHPDLGQLQILTLCRPGILGDVCTHADPDDHGNHVSGIVGATYDNDGAEQGRSRGLSGVNPVADMYGVSYTGMSTSSDNWDDAVSTDDLLTQTLAMTIAEKRAGGALPNLRVINLSAGTIQFAKVTRGPTGQQRNVPVWEDKFANAKCGPLDNDDATGTQLCTPANQDDWLREYAQMSHAALAVARLAATQDVVIVKSSGNSSDDFCDVFGAAPCPHTPNPVPLPVYGTNEFAWAQQNWGASGFPVLLVEAYGTGAGSSPAQPQVATFSQTGGDVSAPGVNVWGTGSHSFFNPITHDCERTSAINFLNSGVVYCAMSGTSMAAPHVTGLLGFLFAFNPELKGPEAIAAVKNAAMADGFSAIGVAPGINAYRTLLSQPGALLALLDVNDDTPDGNQRVVLGAGGSGSSQNVLGPVSYLPSVEFPASPDGQVDMRDFRRFRDAFLQICVEAASEGMSLPANCPNGGSVVLNGSSTNQKKDLNWDHCAFGAKDPNDPASTRDPKSCTTHELAYPRFDFNGDGLVDITTPARVPFGPDGQPLPNGGTTDMTDLDVLLALWPQSQALTEGWSKEQVRSLISSSDLEVHASAFFDAGATEVYINGRRTDGSGELPPRKLEKDTAREDLDQNDIVETVPAVGLDIWASATLPDGQRIESAAQTVYPLPGEDLRLDLCATHLTLDGGPLDLPADGSAQSIFTATLVGCPGDQVSGKPVTFGLTTPGGNGDASLTRGSGVTDTNGRLVTAVTAGTQAADYTLSAEVDLGNGRTVRVTKTLRTTPTVTISYIWRQTVLEWEENGSTRWPNTPAGMPDCTTAGVHYCIDNFQLRNNTPIPEWQSEGLQRKGQLVGSAQRFKLSEEVGGENWSQATYTTDTLDGTPPQEGHFYGFWGPSVSDYNKYQNYPIEGVRTEDTPDALRLFGLKNVGELGYVHGSQTGAGTVLPETYFTRNALLLVPRGDGSAIQSSFNMDGPITFKRRADGSFEPYTFRGVVDTPITSGPRYLQQHPSDWVYGALDLSDIDTHFDPGDRPQLTINGHLKVLYCFEAVATYSGTPLPAALPDCSENHPPTADFTVEFAGSDAGEGRVVQFKDNSSDRDNDIRSWSWDFGEPITPDRQQCSLETADTCHEYADNGIYTVRLTVTDAEGVTASTTKTVVVRNLPPEPDIDGAVGHGVGPQPGCGTISIPARLWDPGWGDQAALTYRITSANSNWPGNATGTLPAGVHAVEVDNLADGEYPLTFTVTDKDGASASASAMAHVVPCEQPIPEPTPQPGAYITCDVTVVLDAEEQNFLNLLNACRIENGLKPLLGVSPTLSKAAVRHSHDMATNNFMAHEGTDGSTFHQRDGEAGYKGSAVGENIARGIARGVDALVSWKGSHEGHNENMLNPMWVSVGIKRERNTTTGEWFWTTDYGNVLDCPTPGPVASAITTDSGEPAPRTIAVLGAGNSPEVFESQHLRFVAGPLQTAAVAQPWRSSKHQPVRPRRRSSSAGCCRVLARA